MAPQPALPTRLPVGQLVIPVIGGENLFYFASKYDGDADQWFRIAYLNAYPGEAPDFIVQADLVAFRRNTLLIPPVNPNAIGT